VCVCLGGGSGGRAGESGLVRLTYDIFLHIGSKIISEHSPFDIGVSSVLHDLLGGVENREVTKGMVNELIDEDWD
jgi:hypothetical protein